MKNLAKAKIAAEICYLEDLQPESFRFETLEKVFFEVGKPDLVLISVSGKGYNLPFRPFSATFKVKTDGSYIEKVENNYFQKKKRAITTNPFSEI